jgi:phosphate uptake regulator
LYGLNRPFLQELERLWQERQKIKWGMPAASYDKETALMLLDPDCADEVGGEEKDWTSSAYELKEGVAQYDGVRGAGDSLAAADLQVSPPALKAGCIVDVCGPRVISSCLATTTLINRRRHALV